MGQVRCSVLQCAAVCCSVQQCAAVCCSVLQCVAVCCIVCCIVCCSVLQCAALCFSVLHRIAVAQKFVHRMPNGARVVMCVLRCVAVRSSVLQYVAG